MHGHGLFGAIRSIQSTASLNRDFYEVLGVSKNATVTKLKRAFYALIQKHLPDINQDDPADEKKFLEIFKAYEVLKDEKQREVYDQDIFKESESSMKQNKHVEIPGYLCVSSGYEIFLLDLEEGNNGSFTDAKDIPFLPKIGTLNLIEKGLPASVGLFNLGSKAYMIGGQKFPDACPPDKPDYNLYKSYCCWTYKMKVSSYDTYTLSLADSVTFKSDTTQLKNPKLHGTKLYRNLYMARNVKCSIGGIFVFKSGIARLNMPKLYPIVEKIGGQIHVIDSIPFEHSCSNTHSKSSHEVFNHDHESWSPISTVKVMCKICSHLVLGHRIYAASISYKMSFDSTTGHWEAPRLITRHFVNPFAAEDVWDILQDGIGRCVRGVTYGPLYVVIALVNWGKLFAFSLSLICLWDP